MPPPRKKKRGDKNPQLDIDRVREALRKNKGGEEISAERKLKKTIAEQAVEKLASSRFRFLNEQLYTQNSSQNFKLFQKVNSALTVFLYSLTPQSMSNWIANNECPKSVCARFFKFV